MRIIAVVLSVALTIGCSSSFTGLPSMDQNCEDRYSRVWMAASRAMTGVGAEVIVSNEPAGAIVGQFPVDLYGVVVMLHVNLTTSPGPILSSIRPITVSVRASVVGEPDPDQMRRDELSFIQEQYLNLLIQRAACGSRSGGVHEPDSS